MLGIDDQAGHPPTPTRRWLGYAITGAWYTWSRVALKAVPVAMAHGIRNDRGPLFAAVELVERGAVPVPGNFVAAAVPYWTQEEGTDIQSMMAVLVWLGVGNGDSVAMRWRERYP